MTAPAASGGLAAEPAGAGRIPPSLPVPRHGKAGSVLGTPLHFASDDVQSAGAGLALATLVHDALALDRIRG